MIVGARRDYSLYRRGWRNVTPNPPPRPDGRGPCLQKERRTALKHQYLGFGVLYLLRKTRAGLLLSPTHDMLTKTRRLNASVLQE